MYNDFKGNWTFGFRSIVYNDFVLFSLRVKPKSVGKQNQVQSASCRNIEPDARYKSQEWINRRHDEPLRPRAAHTTRWCGRKYTNTYGEKDGGGGVVATTHT